jgi:hypothetical protein
MLISLRPIAPVVFCCPYDLGHIGSILGASFWVRENNDSVRVDDEVSSELAPVLPPMEVRKVTTE